MSESEWTDEGRGQQPGADVGDDGDVPDDPLLSPPIDDETVETAERDAS